MLKIERFAKIEAELKQKGSLDIPSLSQLFALIQHEHITIQMLTRPGASNLAPKILSPKEITGNRDTPFERLRKQVRESVLEDERRLKQSKLIAECERLSRLNKNDKIK